MKKPCIFLTATMLVCMLAACGSAQSSDVPTPSESAEPSQSAQPSDAPVPSESAEPSQSGEENPYARTKGLWRMEGETYSASIEMNGMGEFIMYYASGVVEAFGYIECIDEYGNGDFRYDCYSLTDELIVSFYFDSDTRFHIDDVVYLLDMKSAYQGIWEYPDGTILEINGEEWNIYEAGELTLLAGGPVEYDEEAAYLMNDDGSSGGGRLYFDEDGNLIDSDNILIYRGLYIDDLPQG